MDILTIEVICIRFFFQVLVQFGNHFVARENITLHSKCKDLGNFCG